MRSVRRPSVRASRRRCAVAELQDRIGGEKGAREVVRGFLFWSRPRKNSEETRVPRRSLRTLWLQIRHGRLESYRVENPLGVIEQYTDALSPLERDSLWLLYTLAFSWSTVQVWSEEPMACFCRGALWRRHRDRSARLPQST